MRAAAPSKPASATRWVARAEEVLFPRGDYELLAMTGAAEVRALTITPVESSAPDADLSFARLRAAVVPFVLALVTAVLLAFLARGSLLHGPAGLVVGAASTVPWLLTRLDGEVGEAARGRHRPTRGGGLHAARVPRRHGARACGRSGPVLCGVRGRDRTRGPVVPHVDGAPLAPRRRAHECVHGRRMGRRPHRGQTAACVASAAAALESVGHRPPPAAQSSRTAEARGNAAHPVPRDVEHVRLRHPRRVWRSARRALGQGPRGRTGRTRRSADRRLPRLERHSAVPLPRAGGPAVRSGHRVPEPLLQRRPWAHAVRRTGVPRADPCSGVPALAVRRPAGAPRDHRR
jgi:hypothetical protein